MQKILKDDISTLHLEKKIKNKLKENYIDTILDLCNHSRMELGEVGITNSEVNDIIVCLQLIGLDLKKNHAKKNKFIRTV